MPFADYQPGEIAALGEKIYQEQIKSLVYPAEKGKFLFISTWRAATTNWMRLP